MAERFKEAMARGEKKEETRGNTRSLLLERDERREHPESERPLTGLPVVLLAPHPNMSANPVGGENGGVAAMTVPVQRDLAERSVAAVGHSTASTLSGPEFSAILSRLDAGNSVSASTQLNFPGSGWATHQIIVTRRDDILAVIIDADQAARMTTATLEDLRRRLRARGIRNQVEAGQNAGPYERDKTILPDAAS